MKTRPLAEPSPGVWFDSTVEHQNLQRGCKLVQKQWVDGCGTVSVAVWQSNWHLASAKSARLFNERGGLWARLVRNTVIPDDQLESTGCWIWQGRIKGGYPRCNVIMKGKHTEIRPHRAVLVLLEIGPDKELFGDLYQGYGIAQFEADHLCLHNPRCINPDHLRWLTQDEHKDETSKQRWNR